MTTIAPEQLTLNLTPLVEPIYETGMTLAERFEAFHAANPHVADALESLAAQWLSPSVGRGLPIVHAPTLEAIR